MKTDTSGNVWHPAPYQSFKTSGSFQGAWLAMGEEVQWLWAHTPAGSYVYGYTVKKSSSQESWSYIDAKKGKSEEKE